MRTDVLEQVATLMTGAFAFVAALAWNDAVQALVRDLFGAASGTAAKFVYAGFVTVLMVWATGRLTRLLDRLKPPPDS